MNLPCKILASVILTFHFSTRGAAPEEVWAAEGRDFYLHVPDSLANHSIDDVRWKIGNTRIARVAQKKATSMQMYEVFLNGTLKIKNLMRNYSNTYELNVYHKDGKNVLEKTFELKILEGVSKPVVTWNCINKSLTCAVMKGTDPELKLYQNNRNLKKVHQKLITYNWTTNLNVSFKCTASNKASEETTVAAITCPEKDLDIYFIAGICGGGTVFIFFVALLIFFTSKRKKQNRRRNDEELEMRAHRITAEEMTRRPHQIPGSTPQKPAASQPPPAPGHRPQAPGHRPPPPGPQGPHQQQKRAPPPSGSHVPQQKGPPLPRPRVQQKSPAELKKTPSSVA